MLPGTPMPITNLPELNSLSAVAIAVSGGRDSMALAHMLWQAGANLHAITVDHDLRLESANEATQVSQWMQAWDIPHTILKWEGDKPETGLMEAAREARYSLMADFCKKHDIKTLAVGHHGDDQIETFLHRLTKGSGLDGLAVMQPETELFGLTIIRPLLSMTRQQITDYCAQHNIPYIDDPSNEKTNYTRVRFRQFMQSEGLDRKDIMRTISRLSRASDALEKHAETEFTQICTATDPLTLNRDTFLDLHDDIKIRVLVKAMQSVTGMFRPVRLSKVEDALTYLHSMNNQQSYTIGGCLITRKNNQLTLTQEKRKT